MGWYFSKRLVAKEEFLALKNISKTRKIFVNIPMQ